MTLLEFTNHLFTSGLGSVKEPIPYVYVFDSEEELDDFSSGGDNHEILFTIHSDYKITRYLKPEYVNSVVEQFHAIGRNKIGVYIWIDISGVAQMEEKTNGDPN